MLFRVEIFLWLCSTEEQSVYAGSDEPACVTQDVKVQSLFTVCYATHFIISAAAGFLIDVTGPKVTAILGQALNLSDWALLGVCSESFRAQSRAPRLCFDRCGRGRLPAWSWLSSLCH